jgi:hypothetical protein
MSFNLRSGNTTPFKKMGSSPMKNLGKFDIDGNRISSAEADRIESEGGFVKYTNQDAIDKAWSNYEKAKAEGDEVAMRHWETEAKENEAYHNRRMDRNRDVYAGETYNEETGDFENKTYSDIAKLDAERQAAIESGEGGERTSAGYTVRGLSQPREVYTDKDIEAQEQLIDEAMDERGAVTHGQISKVESNIEREKNPPPPREPAFPDPPPKKDE